MKNVKEDILRITLEEIALKGSNGVRLSNISHKVGIQPPSIYAFFNSKEELINESILWGESQVKCNDFKINIALDIKEVLLSLFNHYIKEFSNGINKSYFIVLSKECYNSKEIYKAYQNLLYSIESQINFLLLEKTQDIENEKIMALSNMLSYAFTNIMQIALCESKESAMWEAEDLITSCLYF